MRIEAEGDDPGDPGDPIDYGDGCSAVLFESFDACVVAAGAALGGDLDGDGNIESDAEMELVSYCWIEVANGAFDACCIESPDDSCNTGDDGDSCGDADEIPVDE